MVTKEYMPIHTIREPTAIRRTWLILFSTENIMALRHSTSRTCHVKSRETSNGQDSRLHTGRISYERQNDEANEPFVHAAKRSKIIDSIYETL